ncbi:glycoside hydrolase family 9 protein [Pseudobacteriovorax antillogorgiicola]|uniref:Endoglucanase n=1 Tax=Pseudobacteriovorax antillogorgiicola TaxID=1513793 RepID=A0A1Y6BG24_9BACT|nr:glycoside hydrolase family 9 protein [Pseudobacteriovorax antillogorgiicola]TCS57395.1 cellulose binding domain-containing protein [Pseudobacteriovorax antillogorgiicola]SMF01608.1 Cellulose binding domain-containing protein [Pseudobacteriovorax antillogorgiicola]
MTLDRNKLVGLSFLIMSPVAIGANYGEALQKSIYFYEAQQSGVLPDWNRVEWRGDSALSDGQDVGIDLTGGWFDAGDHVKFGLPMAASTTMLAWGYIEYPEAYQRSQQETHLKNNLRFVGDYFIKAHPEPNVLWGQVGNGSKDHAWWGPAEVMPMERPSYKIDASCPGSELAGETSAAMASLSMIFRKDDPDYAATLLQHSKELYSFAYDYRGKYSDCITDAQGYYNSWSGYEDELVWSALWLYRATGDKFYLKRAQEDYENLNTENQSELKSYKWTQAWDDKSYGSYVLMAKLSNGAKYQEDAERWLDYWTVGFEGNRIAYTPGGLAYLDTWGPTRYAANTAFLALIYSDYLKNAKADQEKATRYYDFAVSQMEYILGKNPANISFQIGLGDNYPKNPHHRTAHGAWTNNLQQPEQSRHLLVGALVGGPNRNDGYEDDRGDYILNEVATDYNAGFTSALARLYLDFGGDPIPEKQFPPKEEKDLEFFVEAKVNSQGPRYIEIAARVHNRSAWPARNAKNLALRYYVDLTEELALGYKPSDIKVSTAYSQATSVSPLTLVGKGIYYIEISFEGVNIFPGGQSESKKEVQFRLSLPSNTNTPEWSNDQDPSWDAYGSQYKNAEKIVLFDGEQLVWGKMP